MVYKCWWRGLRVRVALDSASAAAEQEAATLERTQQRPDRHRHGPCQHTHERQQAGTVSSPHRCLTQPGHRQHRRLYFVEHRHDECSHQASAGDSPCHSGQECTRASAHHDRCGYRGQGAATVDLLDRRAAATSIADRRACDKQGTAARRQAQELPGRRR